MISRIENGKWKMENCYKFQQVNAFILKYI